MTDVEDANFDKPVMKVRKVYYWIKTAAETRDRAKARTIALVEKCKKGNFYGDHILPGNFFGGNNDFEKMKWE